MSSKEHIVPLVILAVLVPWSVFMSIALVRLTASVNALTAAANNVPTSDDAALNTLADQVDAVTVKLTPPVAPDPTPAPAV